MPTYSFSTDGLGASDIAFPMRDKVLHPCGYKIGMTFCLRPCPVLFGAVTRLPAKTATGPSEGDQHAGSLRMVQG